jgi:hypothetical protein
MLSGIAESFAIGLNWPKMAWRHFSVLFLRIADRPGYKKTPQSFWIAEHLFSDAFHDPSAQQQA